MTSWNWASASAGSWRVLWRQRLSICGIDWRWLDSLGHEGPEFVDALETIEPGDTGHVRFDDREYDAKNIGAKPIVAHHHARLVRRRADRLEIDGDPRVSESARTP